MIDRPVAVSKWLGVPDGSFDVAFRPRHRLLEALSPCQRGGDGGGERAARAVGASTGQPRSAKLDNRPAIVKDIDRLRAAEVTASNHRFPCT